MNTSNLPNILWITSEDHGPHMGCYGDEYATTPNIDALAAKGMIYRHVWSNAPVCSAARTTIISGLYATSTGGEQMRSMVSLPDGFRMFPQFLRDAGYTCTNNSKEDYNLEKPGQVWDESSKDAHWNKRPDQQPFFAVFNATLSHESKLRARPHEAIHDPAGVRIPAYHPDTPETRQDWAQYYDTVTDSDRRAGERLKELEEAGLLEDTIVFYYADHGCGMPGNKRTANNAGLQVPLVVYIPEKFQYLRPPDYRPGGKSDRLIGFVDLAPTVLSLAGIEPPEWMQGRAFLGHHQMPAPEVIHGFRGRMDERYDLVRSVTDGRHVYIRNYMPHLPNGQHVTYMFQTPTTAIWKRMFDEGRLNPAQEAFWRPKPPEELYDLTNDPDGVVNLVDDQAYRIVLGDLRRAQRSHAASIERYERAMDSSPYQLGHDPARYPFEQIFEAAERASSLRPDAIPALIQAIKNEDSTIRYWGALGILMQGKPAVSRSHKELVEARSDFSPYVRITAAQALGQYGRPEDLSPSLALLVAHANGNSQNCFVVMAALNSLGALGSKASPVADEIAALPTEAPYPAERYSGYVIRLHASLNDSLEISRTQPTD